jgi:hypothetical protein
MTRASESLSMWRRQRKAAREGRALIPATGLVDDLVTAVGASRGRPFRLLGAPLRGTMTSGAWLPTPQADYVLYPKSASPTRREAVICHELGHVLLHHDPALHDALTPALLGEVAPSLSLSTARAMLFRSSYTNREEADAEYVGTVLATALADRREARDWESSSRLSEHLR